MLTWKKDIFCFKLQTKMKVFTGRLEHATWEFVQFVSNHRITVNGLLLEHTFLFSHVSLRT